MKNKFVTTLIAAIVLLGTAVHAQDAPPETPLPAPAAWTEPAETIETEPAESPVENPGSAETNSGRPFRHGALVTIAKDAHLETNRVAKAVVAIGGSANAAGIVHDSVVAIFGDTFSAASVGESVVAILGNARVDASVSHEVVAVLGNVMLSSNSIVGGNVVAVGGTVTIEEGAVVRGEIQEIPFGIPGLPQLRELPVWVRECVFKLRLLSFEIGWAWLVVAFAFALYAFVAIIFHRPVAICADELSRRPATTFLVGLLAKMLIPFIILILLATGIGVLALPFLFAAILFAAILGKVAMLQYIGSALPRASNLSGAMKNLLALLIGSIVIIALYLIPIVGFFTFAITGIWALGIAITAGFTHMTRERPRPPQNPGVPPTNPLGPVPPGQQGTTAESIASNPGMISTIHQNALLSRAGFWERMGAGFLDVALLVVPLAILGPWIFPVALAYFAGMWTWKGTTIGGMVLRQRVVRYNGEPLTFTVAIVRGLASVFSAFVFFLGFFWIGWSREKQAWHDIIAGTYVVRTPQAMPLVCL